MREKKENIGVMSRFGGMHQSYLHTQCNHNVPLNSKAGICGLEEWHLRTALIEVPYKGWQMYENLKIDRRDRSCWRSFVIFDHFIEDFLITAFIPTPGT